MSRNSKKLTAGMSELYVGKSTLFKVALLVGVLVVSGFFVWYTFRLVDQLQRDTRDQVEKYIHLWQFAANSPTSGDELSFIFDEIIVKATFPIVVLSVDREPIYWRNLTGIAPEDTSTAAKKLVTEAAVEMLESNGEFPLYYGETRVNYLRYGDTEVIKQLRVMPFVVVGVVGAFMLVGFIGFHNIRRSEERLIWVGMAKETAHQLGTPLSSLLGWLEVINADETFTRAKQENNLVGETIDNMKVDVERLQRVTNRFSQIGSVPELVPHDVNELIEDTVTYYRRRLPFEGEGTKINFERTEMPQVNLSAELFGWVLENLVKNSLQAVDPKDGRVDIRLALSTDQRDVLIRIEDNGRGISAPAVRKIFRPGFTSKKRGWGMGLTLVKRIVEEYHVGKITLVKSRPGETVFEIRLPVSGER